MLLSLKEEKALTAIALKGLQKVLTGMEIVNNPDWNTSKSLSQRQQDYAKVLLLDKEFLMSLEVDDAKYGPALKRISEDLLEKIISKKEVSPNENQEQRAA